MSDAIESKKFGPVRLEPGVFGHHMLTYLFATITSLLIFTFMPQAQPLILSDVLNIPEAQQGVVSGNLGFFHEILLILTIGFFGTVSDRIGRKPVMAFGFLSAGVGVILYPQAQTIFQLYAFRIFYSLGSAAITTMLATIIADYAIDEDRGKASGLQGVGNAIGAMLTVFVLLQLPAMFQADGLSTAESISKTYLVAALIAGLSVVIVLVGLQGRTKRQAEQKKPLLEIAREGLRASKDPGVALAYAAAFVSRGDLAIVGTFFTLWITTYGTEKLGMTTADALARAGIIIGISQGFALIGAPLFGYMADKMNRVLAVVAAVGVSSIGYGSTYFVDDPFTNAIFFSAVVIGLGEVGGVIASGVLIAQQAPSEIRGSVIGFFSFAGAVGILIANLVGGWLFDNWDPSGPFVLFAIFGFMVSIWGLIIKNKVVPLNEGAQAVGGH